MGQTSGGRRFVYCFVIMTQPTENPENTTESNQAPELMDPDDETESPLGEEDIFGFSSSNSGSCPLWNEDDEEEEETKEISYREEAPPGRTEPTLTASQRAVVSELKKMLYLKIYHPNKAKSVRLRSHILIAGPSGTGKSEAVRHFAQNLRLPLMGISLMNWTVFGAKAEPHTGRCLNAFLSQHDYGVIFLDEINKLRNEHLENSWFMGVFSEVLCLLDADDRLEGIGIEPDNIRKLRESFLIIAAGAWQDEWNACQPKPTAGFIPTVQSKAEQQLAFDRAVTQSGGLLPEELLFRFNEKVLFVQAPTTEEISERIAWVREEVGACKLSPPRLAELAWKCEQSGRALRWLEAYLNEVFEESQLARHVDILLSATEIKRTIAERNPNQRKEANLNLLLNSILEILHKLALDGRLMAAELLERHLLDRPAKAEDELGKALQQFCTACKDCTSPVYTKDLGHWVTLQSQCTQLLPLLTAKNLGRHPSVSKKEAAARLRVQLQLLREEYEHYKMLVFKQQDLISWGIPNAPDPRLGWFSRI